MQENSSSQNISHPLPLNGEGTGGRGLFSLFSCFFTIGLFTIGGGYAMIPLMQEKIIDKNKWIEKGEFLDLIAIAQSCPGVFAINIAIFVGYKMNKIKGAIAACLGAALPSFLIILPIAIFFTQFKDVELVKSIFAGIRPAVVALIAVPTFKLAKSANITWKTVWIPILSALLIWLLGVSPIYIIMCAGLAGYLYGRFCTKD